MYIIIYRLVDLINNGFGLRVLIVIMLGMIQFIFGIDSLAKVVVSRMLLAMPSFAFYLEL
uniref:Uncharacterized protein LOC114346563 isoform X2 n=1 Tax=Diabrotica virgifera virgifera TaxID=50390 RepID=A0A6P7GTH6_DIAVI